MSEVCKLVVVGDGEIGKTCMISCYTQDKFPDQYQPTVIDFHKGYIEFESKNFELHVWDTAG